MAACPPIRLKLPGSAEMLFPQARAAILAKGGQVQGNAVSGSASVPSPVGQIVFDYRTEGADLVITVTDKPWALSCARIENELRAGLAQVKAPAPTAPVDPDAGPGDAAPEEQRWIIDVGPAEIISVEEPQRRPKLWPWGLGLVAVIGWLAWRPGGFTRR